jgi:cupin superfamily acireductone dioxygenase involved in methionine salvage
LNQKTLDWYKEYLYETYGTGIFPSIRMKSELCRQLKVSYGDLLFIPHGKTLKWVAKYLDKNNVSYYTERYRNRFLKVIQ